MPSDSSFDFYLTKKDKILIALFLVFLILLAFSIYFKDYPTTKSVELREVEYTHIANYTYIAYLKPNILYEKTELHPNEGKIFRSLLKRLDITMHYRVIGKNVTGFYTVFVIVDKAKDWSKTIAYIPPKNFNNEFTFTYDLNFTDVERLVEKINRETRTSSGYYTIRIRPEVHIGADVFTPELNIRVSGNVVTFEKLNHTLQKTNTKVLKVDNTINVLNYSLSVAELKKAINLLTMIDIILISLVLVLMKQPNRELLKRLINVEKIPVVNKVVQVKSEDDLVKIARSLNKPIFKSDDIYFVIDNDTRYEYTPLKQIKRMEKTFKNDLDLKSQ